MEQNKEMTAQESLALIAETMNKSRKSIVQRSGKYMLVWGIALTVVSLLVFTLWKSTGKTAWNYLWFLMPVAGLIPALIMKRKESVSLPENSVSKMLASIWRTFGVFAVSVSVFTILYIQFNDSLFGEMAAAISLSPIILLLFGMAETLSGVTVKNQTIKVAGFVTGIGGLALYYLICANGEGMESTLLFTLAGVVLAVTGIILRIQNKE